MYSVEMRELFSYKVPEIMESKSRSVMSDSVKPHGLYSPWNSPDQNTGVGSLSLLQGIFPTEGWNPGLPHCRWILYQLSHQGSPDTLEIRANVALATVNCMRPEERGTSTSLLTCAVQPGAYCSTTLTALGEKKIEMPADAWIPLPEWWVWRWWHLWDAVLGFKAIEITRGVQDLWTKFEED